MQHYFSLHMLVHFYYGPNKTKSPIKKLVRTHKIVPYISVEDFRTKKLNTKDYFSIPQLIAFDFYMCAYKYFISNSTRNNLPVFRSTMRDVCHKISDLPHSGWDISKFKVIMINPRGIRGYMVTIGTLFECITNFSVAKNNRLCYTGEEFIGRLKEMHKDPIVYNKTLGSCRYWDINVT